MQDTMKRPDRGHTRFGARGASSKARKSHSSNSINNINFKAINEAAVPALPLLLARWLPGGKRIGREYMALNPTRVDRKLGSFKINLRSGCWADFATGDRGGDPISLIAYLFGLRQGEAARKLAGMLGVRHD